MPLAQKTVAFLMAEGTPAEEVEPLLEAMASLGARNVIVGPNLETLERLCLEKRRPIAAGMAVEVAQDIWFDALVIPGGAGIEGFVQDEEALEFVVQFERDMKPIAVIGEGLLVLAAAEMVACKEVAAAPALWETLEEAGGRPRHLDVVEDENWISGRDAKDAPAVAERLAAMLARTPLPACEVPPSVE